MREVDEAVRADRAEALARRWGGWIAGALVLMLAALGGWFIWQNHNASLAGEHGKVMMAGLDNLVQNRPRAAMAAVDPLAKGDDPTYRALAHMVQGAGAGAQNDASTASARFGIVANDAAVAQPLRDAALVRQLLIQFDAVPPATVITRLQSVVAHPGPAFASAAELVALAEMKRGNDRAAGQWFKRIAETADAPDSLKARAAQMASMLGVEVAPSQRPASAAAQAQAQGTEGQ